MQGNEVQRDRATHKFVESVKVKYHIGIIHGSSLAIQLGQFYPANSPYYEGGPHAFFRACIHNDIEGLEDNHFSRGVPGVLTVANIKSWG